MVKMGIFSLVSRVIPPVTSQLTTAFLMNFVWFTNWSVQTFCKKWVDKIHHELLDYTEEQPHRACERTKSKQKLNQACHIQIDHAFYCAIDPRNSNGIIKGWLHCQTSESKGRFLVNVLTFSSVWCLSDHVANPIFFNKKNKDWMSRTLATPHRCFQ